jgi:serine-type D-Ala-D-Ala carboxypeptidase/endopeptidase
MLEKEIFPGFSVQPLLHRLAPDRYDPAIPPVSAADLQSVLDRDLELALERGKLAPWTGVGVTVGVVRQGIRRIFSYGAAKPDSLFEIGSLTKPFTGLALAQMAEQGKVALDEPVRDLLPPGTVPKPTGPEITLLDLATQRSGLPRLPGNLKPYNPENPYVHYSAAMLYAFLREHGLARPANAAYLYSNLGYGLLGHALALRAGVSFAQLIQIEIAGPLALADTVIDLSSQQQRRLIPGLDALHGLAHAWNLGVLGGAGALRSTAGDLLTFLEAQLHPESIASALGFASGTTLGSAVRLSQQLRAPALPGMSIALAWLQIAKSGSYWHNGATGGYSSYAFFNQAGNYAAAVLVNSTLSAKGSFADRLGVHISQRLAGVPAVALSD